MSDTENPEQNLWENLLENETFINRLKIKKNLRENGIALGRKHYRSVTLSDRSLNWFNKVYN